MQQKRRYKRRKLKPKIKIFIFVLLSLFIIHTGNNLLKLSHASKNEISNKTSTQVDNKSKNIDQSSVKKFIIIFQMMKEQITQEIKKEMIMA